MKPPPPFYNYPRHPWLAAFLAFGVGFLGLLYTSSILAVLAAIIYMALLGLIGTSIPVLLGVAAICGVAGFLWATHPPELSRFPLLAQFDRPGWVKALVLGAVLLAVFYGYTKTIYTVVGYSGYSMSPTFRAGERAPLTIAPLLRGPVHRGDVIRFAFPGDSRKRMGISRVVALAGDKVEVKRGVLYVNGKGADNPQHLQALKLAGCVAERLTLNNTAVGHVEAVPELPVTVAEAIPAGSVAVISDNRSDNFQDSRFFGPLPTSAINGVLRLRDRNLSPVKPEDCQPPQSSFR
ncbi:signal peptidase I [Deinococcus sp. D7000]|nr:signal peptidase I [Deinococcus sp. D7000]